MSMLTRERLYQLFHYDSETGVFTRRISCGNRALAGSIANGVNAHGYVSIMIDGRRYYGHRLAWLYVHGEWLPRGLDHKDTIRSHNWISNLRVATQRQNVGNSRLRRTSSSGFKGVYWHQKAGRWAAQIAGEYLGLFDTPEDAHAAYTMAAKRHFGEFARAA